jgi:hypothetical protein
MQPDTVEALNHLIERSYLTVKNGHAWTWEDHGILESAIKLVERDGTAPLVPDGWLPSRRRATMRSHRYGQQH